MVNNIIPISSTLSFLGTLIILIHLVYSFELAFLQDKNSFVEYGEWNGSAVSSFRLKFSTPSETGILAYTEDGKHANHFLLISLHSGVLIIKIRIGEENAIQKKSLGDNLDDLEWHELELVRNYRSTTIILDSMETMVFSSGKSSTLQVKPSLYIGGVPSNILSRPSFQHYRSFVGCIKDIETKHKDGNYRAINKLKTNLTFGCPNKCPKKTPGNKQCGLGKCKNNYIKASCDCFTTHYQGPKCETRSQSYQLNGMSFLAFKDNNMRYSSANKVEFRFRTLIPNGLIFTGGKGHDYWTIEMFHGNIRVNADIGGGKLTVIGGDGRLHNGRWHSVRVSQKGAIMTLNIDNVFRETHSSPNGFAKTCDKDELDTFFIGGHHNIMHATGSLSKIGYNGCLQKFYFNGEDIFYRNKRYSHGGIVGSIEGNCDISPTTKIEMIGTGIDKEKTTSSMTNRFNPSPGTSGNKHSELDSSGAEERSGQGLSESTVDWITGGIVTGSIVLILAVAFLVRYLKRKYSGSFVATSMNQNDYSSVHLYGGQPACYVTNGRPGKGTHI